MPAPPLDQVTLAVLAGGAGTRMGRAKSLLEIGGKPILEYLAERLDWPGPTLLVTSPGRENPPESARFDREVSDSAVGEGPLRGILTALEHAVTDVTVFTGVDMPAVDRRDLAWFVGELASRPDCLGVMASRAGSIEPLPCALRSSAVAIVSAHLAAGRRSLHEMAQDRQIEVIDASGLPARAWLNVNTPAEWNEFLRELG